MTSSSDDPTPSRDTGRRWTIPADHQWVIGREGGAANIGLQGTQLDEHATVRWTGRAVEIRAAGAQDRPVVDGQPVVHARVPVGGEFIIANQTFQVVGPGEIELITTPHTPQKPMAQPAGWYSDPDGSGGQRWWDGQRWTSRRLPPTSGPTPVAPSIPHLPPPQRTSSPPANIQGFWNRLSTAGRVAVVATPVVLVAIISAIAFGSSSHEAADSSSSSSSSSTRAAPSGPLPSSSDDWQRAVCRPGTYQNGAGVLRNSTGSAICMSLNGVPIGIGTYTSNFALDNDVALFHNGMYATTTTETGETYVFVAMTASQSNAVQQALMPLTSFGFQLHSVQ